MHHCLVLSDIPFSKNSPTQALAACTEFNEVELQLLVSAHVNREHKAPTVHRVHNVVKCLFGYLPFLTLLIFFYGKDLLSSIFFVKIIQSFGFLSKFYHGLNSTQPNSLAMLIRSILEQTEWTANFLALAWAQLNLGKQPAFPKIFRNEIQSMTRVHHTQALRPCLTTEIRATAR